MTKIADANKNIKITNLFSIENGFYIKKLKDTAKPAKSWLTK